MKNKWTWIIILCLFNFSLMTFILTHPATKNVQPEVVQKISKKEDKKSFSIQSTQLSNHPITYDYTIE